MCVLALPPRRSGGVRRKMSFKARQLAADRIAREREEVKALERTIAVSQARFTHA